jgi:hypothetical protein
MKLGVVSLAFRCTLAGGEARTPEESDAVCWWALEELGRDAPEARAVSVVWPLGEGACVGRYRLWLRIRG